MRSVYSYGPLRKCGKAMSREARQASRAPPPMKRGRWTRLPKKLTKMMRTVFPTWTPNDSVTVKGLRVWSASPNAAALTSLKAASIPDF